MNDGDGGEVNDTLTWIKWSKEESSRDCDQWMPVRGKSGRIFSPFINYYTSL